MAIDPFTLMSLVSGAASLFSKKAKQPEYKPQEFKGQYNPQEFGGQYQSQRLEGQPDAPQDQQDQQGTDAGNALFQTVIGNQLANYNAGKPLLGEGYRNAVLGQAKRSFDLSANESGNQVNEQYNRLNLLGATGHGQALGEVQRSRLQGLGNIEDELTQDELQQLNNATQQGMSLQNAFQQRGNDQFRNRLAGAQYGQQNAMNQFNTGQQNAMNQFNTGLQTYQTNQGERQNAYQNSLAGYGANQAERMKAYGGAQDAAKSQTNLGTGLLSMGFDAYKNRTPLRNNSGLAESLDEALARLKAGR